ncbi:MAG: DUF4263 domain-containing protein [Bacilli bacterium]|nr:DUF4263 domain-containing protein [Bacilli bacterium]
MIEFVSKEGKILMNYMPYNGTSWINENLIDEERGIKIKSFYFNKNDILFLDEDKVVLQFASLKDDGYYYIKKRVTQTNGKVKFNNLSILNIKYLMVNSNLNIFQAIEEVRNDDNLDISIGNSENDINSRDFLLICDKFPNSYEKDLYYNSRVYDLLSNYFEDLIDYNKKYTNYINKKYKEYDRLKLESISRYELKKYEIIKEKLEEYLVHEDMISEEDWKKLIADIILLLFPQYINYHREFSFNLENSDRNKMREQIDFLLVNSNGCVDILEVKKSNCPSIISSLVDRGNYFSSNTLSKTLMQTEKYIYNLQRNSIKSEDLLNRRYSSFYGDDFSFRIINPKGLIIAGKKSNYNKRQLNDLEVIKKMYANIINIYTYDDLIEMLNRQIQLLKKKI